MSISTQTPVILHDEKDSQQSPFSAMLVLVGGLPGTGKTYFALGLSDKLNATYIRLSLQ